MEDRKYLVVIPEGGDLDALSSCFGLSLLYDCPILKPLNLSRRASLAFKTFKDIMKITEELPKEFFLLSGDTSSLKDLRGDIFKAKILGALFFDHHRREDVGSATTLVVERIREKGLRLKRKEATLLSLGIYEDTGRLTYDNTTLRDLKALEYLFSFGIDFGLVRKILSTSLSEGDLERLKEVLTSVESLYLKEGKVSIALLRVEEYEPQILEKVYKLQEFEDSCAFFLIVEAGKKTYLFGRSRGCIDTSKVLREFGGGGHSYASALKLEEVSGQRLKNYLMDFLRGKGKVKVSQIMNPPFVLHKDTPLYIALKELKERGFAGAPVVGSDGKFLGVVMKKSLLKVYESFKEEKVENFLQRDVVCVEEEESLWKVEELVLRGQKIIPVLREGYVVGVITRMDVISHLRQREGSPKPRLKRINLPKDLEELCKALGEVAKSKGLRIYLVGGVVRDLILKRELKDLDFVVEGDALTLREEVERKLNVRTHTFFDYKSFHFSYKNFKVEVSSSRREIYLRPSYPEVERANLRQDLIRRDFTINALALSVNEEDFGTLIDFFGGLEDLRRGIVRVLHPVSFVEDPVRILRALRFCARFNFKLSRGTEELLKRALKLGVLEVAPKGRVFKELSLALKEENLLELLNLYRKYGIMERLFKGFSWQRLSLEEIRNLREFYSWYSLEFGKKDVSFGYLILLYLLKDLNPKQELKLMNVPSRILKLLEEVKGVGGLIKKLMEAEKPSQIYQTLKGLDLYMVLLLSYKRELTNKLILFLKELKGFKLPQDILRDLKERYRGRELGQKIEEKKRELMDERFGK